MVTINPALNKLPTYPAEALYAKKRELKASGVEVFDFSVGDPIEPTDSAIVAAFERGIPRVSQYPTVAGLAAFRQAVGEWFSRRFGVVLDPETQVLPTSGSKEAIFHLPLVFLDPHGPRRRVLFGTPAYPVYERGTLFANGEPWSVELRPEDGYRLEPWKLPAADLAQTAIIWINYPHNPTAATVGLDYLRELHQFCLGHDILLCADECYTDTYFDPHNRPPSLMQVGHEGALCFHSLSKRSGLTGYRSGFVTGDPELLSIFRGARGNFGVAQSVMVQRAAVAAWQDDQHAEKRRQFFRAKRDLFVDFFAEAGLQHEPCDATLYLWVRLPAGQPNVLRYAEHLMERGILVSPAPMHGVDQPYFRLALVPSLDDCRRAIEVWRSMRTD